MIKKIIFVVCLLLLIPQVFAQEELSQEEQIQKFQEMMKVNNTQMSEADAEKMFLENAKNSPIAKYIDVNTPLFKKYITFMVKLTRDPKLFNNLMKIPKDKKKGKHYLIAMLSILIASFLLSLFEKKGLPWYKRLVKKVLMLVMMLTAQVGVMVYFYGKELKPVFTLAKNVFFT